MADRRGSGRAQQHPRLYQYQRDRRKFAVRVYSIAALFLVISFVQWVPFLLTSSSRAFFVDYYYVGITMLFLALVTITAIIFCEGIRFIFPFNWLLSLLIVEFVTLGLARAVVDSNAFLFGVSFSIVTPVVVLFVVAGIMLPRDLTLDVVILFVCAIVFFIGAVFFLILAILSDIHFSIVVFACFIIATVLLFVMYHAQTINGGRYAEMRLNDFLLAALIIYHDFVILFMLTLFLATLFFGKPLLFNIYGSAGQNCTACPTVKK